MGEGLRAGKLVLPDGLRLVTDADATVITVERPRSEDDAQAKIAPETGKPEPEVLTARKEEEGEAATGDAAAKEKEPAKDAGGDAAKG
jgi:hypothetical protein